ncbi:hypothetical protein VTL71DRAFT_7395 [Oculimacula yallundae]|uniref:Uncharacterized protein n=1 Tax=Oculimacula yallundae TaxID=86028 RepID=A0ABR4BTZ5_9HELO
MIIFVSQIDPATLPCMSWVLRLSALAPSIPQPTYHLPHHIHLRPPSSLEVLIYTSTRQAPSKARQAAKLARQGIDHVFFVYFTFRSPIFLGSGRGVGSPHTLQRVYAIKMIVDMIQRVEHQAFCAFLSGRYVKIANPNKPDYKSTRVAHRPAYLWNTRRPSPSRC